MPNRYSLYIAQARSAADRAEYFRLECISAIIRGDVWRANTYARFACHSRRNAIIWAYNAIEARRQAIQAVTR